MSSRAYSNQFIANIVSLGPRVLDQSKSLMTASFLLSYAIRLIISNTQHYN